MKSTNNQSISQRLVIFFALLVSVNVGTIRLAQGQTFSGEDQLRPDPTLLPAVIFPINHSTTFRINVINPRGGALTITIRDDKGRIHYADVSYHTRFAGLFDLAPMGAGTYTFELRNQVGQNFTQTVRIETPVPHGLTLDDSLPKGLDQAKQISSIRP
ncbi:hypothetical protein [Spirosoma pulveris]